MLLNFSQLGILWTAKSFLFSFSNMVLVKSTLAKIKQNIDAQAWNEHVQSLLMQNPAETPKRVIFSFCFLPG